MNESGKGFPSSISDVSSIVVESMDRLFNIYTELISKHDNPSKIIDYVELSRSVDILIKALLKVKGYLDSKK